MMLRVIVEESGAGQIEYRLALDEAAAAELGDIDEIVFDDVTSETGWTIARERAPDDSQSLITVSKSFTALSQLNDLFVELGGDPAIFSLGDDVGVTSTTDDITYRLHVNLHLTGTPDQFSDAALTEVLNGFPVGFTQKELDLKLAQMEAPMTLDVEFVMPGVVETTGRSADPLVTSIRGGDATSATWSIPVVVGEPTSAEFVAISEVGSSTTMLIRLAGMLGLIALLFLSYGFWVRRTGLRRRRSNPTVT